MPKRNSGGTYTDTNTDTNSDTNTDTNVDTNTNTNSDTNTDIQMRMRLVVVYLAPAREKLCDTKEKWQTAGVGGWWVSGKPFHIEEQGGCGHCP